MTTSALITIDAADIDTRFLCCDHTDSISATWSIRVVDTLGHQVWLQGTVDELEEAHVRLGEHITSLLGEIAQKAARVQVQEIAHLAGIETAVNA